MDFAAEGLLDDLEGEELEARRKLLQQLVEDGFGLEDLRAAVAEDRLVLLPLHRRLGGCYTAEELEERTGVPAELALRLRRASGLPDAETQKRVFGEEDVRLAESMQRFLDAGLGESAIIEMSRVLGEAMSRVATTTGSTFVETFLRAGDSEDEVAERFATLAEELAPAFEPVFMATFKAHLRDGVQRGMLSRAQREAGSVGAEQPLGVCFADVVGFTRLGAEVELETLGNVAGQLSEIASDVVTPEVRLVKTIGDAAMFVARDPGPLVGVALSLLDAFEEEQLPTLRAGIAYGPALLRGGDFFGHSVNLASRVTGISRPGSVLCTQEVHDAAPEDFEWSFAGKHRLKGIEEALALHRARPRREPDTGEAEPDSEESGRSKTRREDRRRKRGRS